MSKLTARLWFDASASMISSISSFMPSVALTVLVIPSEWVNVRLSVIGMTLAPCPGS